MSSRRPCLSVVAYVRRLLIAAAPRAVLVMISSTAGCHELLTDDLGRDASTSDVAVGHESGSDGQVDAPVVDAVVVQEGSTGHDASRDSSPTLMDSSTSDASDGSNDDDGGGSTGPQAIQVQDVCDEIYAWNETKLNLSYGVLYNHIDDTDLKMDIAAPKTPGPHPMIVVIHGGGWYFGEKEDHRSTIKFLATQGYVAASVEYRLMQYPDGGPWSFPACAQDVRCATRWLKANAAKYGGDPERVAALGDSAGGHLASVLGTESDVEGLDAPCSVGTDISPSVKAVVAYYPPEDIRVPLMTWNDPGFDLRPRQVILSLLRGTPEDHPALATLASPIAHIDKDDPPFLLLHGTKDDVVPVEQSREMYKALHSAGVRATYIELPTQGHAFPAFAFSQTFYRSSCTAVAFLKQELTP